MLHTAYIALGSNLGKRQIALRSAIDRIGKLPDTHMLDIATFRKTTPVGGPPGQGPYINSAVAVQTELSPHQLLDAILQIERDLGRNRSQEPRNGPRALDLDLLLYDDLVLTGADDRELTVPHPRMHERLFVLEPLTEISPGLVHPVLKRTVKELLDGLKSSV